MPRPSRLILLVAVAIALGFSQLVRYTYPINVGAYDYPNYVRMIAEGSSNLVHASGYPAILHFLTGLLTTPPGEPYVMASRWLDMVQRVQTLLHFVLFASSIRISAALFGFPAATVIALFWGLNGLFTSNVNAAAPEWLQAELAILALLLGALAGTRHGWRQVGLLFTSAVVFAGAYLVKYNTLLLAPIFAVLIFVGAVGWRRRVVHACVVLATIAGLVSVYISAYHQPSTGSRALSFDHAWVFATALPEGYLRRDPETLGPHALRFVALAALTPPEYERAQAFDRIDWGAPPEVRRTYEKTFNAVMGMQRAELVEILKRQPLPDGFSHFVSSIPLYYYYGLEKTDALGMPLYLEGVWALRQFYAVRLPRGVWSQFITIPAPRVVPTPSAPLGSSFGAPAADGFARIAPPAELASPLFAPYFNPTRRVHMPGVNVVDWVIAAGSHQAIYIAINVLTLFGLAVHPNRAARLTGVLLAAGVLMFAAGSMMLVGFRSKEVVAITPVYFVAVGIGLTGTWSFAARMIASPRRRDLTSERVPT